MNTPDKEQARTLVYKALRRTNELLPDGGQVEENDEAVLLGQPGGLDSMGFINFVVALEDEVEKSTGVNVRIVEELNAMRHDNERPTNVGSFVTFLQGLLVP